MAHAVPAAADLARVDDSTEQSTDAGLATHSAATQPVAPADLARVDDSAEQFPAVGPATHSTQPVATAEPAATHSAADYSFIDILTGDQAFAASASSPMAFSVSTPDDLELAFGKPFANHFHTSSAYEVALRAHRDSLRAYKASMSAYKAALDAFTVHQIPLSAHLIAHLASFNSHMSSLNNFEATMPTFNLDTLDAGGCSRGSSSRRSNSSSGRLLRPVYNAAYEVDEANPDLEDLIVFDDVVEPVAGGEPVEVNVADNVVFHNHPIPEAFVPVYWAAPSFQSYDLAKPDLDTLFPVNVEFPQFERVKVTDSCYSVRGRTTVQELVAAIVQKLTSGGWVPPPQPVAVLRTEGNEDVPADVLLGQVFMRDMAQSVGVNLSCYFVVEEQVVEEQLVEEQVVEEQA